MLYNYLIYTAIPSFALSLSLTITILFSYFLLVSYVLFILMLKRKY